MRIDRGWKNDNAPGARSGLPGAFRFPGLARLYQEDGNVSTQLRPTASWSVLWQVPGNGLPRKVSSGEIQGEATKAAIAEAIEAVREAIRQWHTSAETLKNGKPMGIVWFEMSFAYRESNGRIHV